MSEWLDTIVWSIGLIIAFAVIFKAILFLIDVAFEVKAYDKFESDFKQLLVNSEPSWGDVKTVAESRDLGKRQLHRIMRSVYRDILTGANSELAQHKELVKSFLEAYDKDEPYEGLPSEIRVHLDRLNTQLKEHEHLLSPLTSQIKELVAVNDKEKKAMKYYTISSFFVGLLGVIYAFYTSWQ
ncbi:hypothetical protein [Vibrio cyclitrophicus]|uniref:Uncharacterized protein n=1 Tax=Vibrio cyclitrophicus ZF270 TaxID=1136176 RepID=A0AAN0LSK7_9VIBR|nr:hypothetical protein [Vibrio cyclitrophicus]OBT23504.1 hypothetical protein A9263_10565 [Vibrio cyclitrophicus]OED77559.1 hypothetical protein OAS_11530 [Vibrio cyclitrophicus ZF65]OED99192.1 hypothetical protein OAO_16165 [Vibrio cyclitrophicus ZF28]OEE02693.1 hypothetical protein OC7_12405 [Vibrio cyclitrophicus ZF270]OEE16295.1 hypothetical protein OAY_05585 [Vibrio cyclitrophicus ZF205]